MENTLSEKGRQAILPQSGRFLSEDFAALLGYEPKTFRQLLKAEKIRTIQLGSKVIIDAEWLWQDLVCRRSEATEKARSFERPAAATESPSQKPKTAKKSGAQKPPGKCPTQ